MKKFDEVDLSEEEIQVLKAIIDDFELEDRFVRDLQIREWKRLELMWAGYNNFYWDYVAHDWRIWNNDLSGSGDNQSAYYDKNINVFRAYLETIIAALSNTVPPIKCIPDDADNINDVLTAKGGSKIAELIYNHVDAPLLWVRMLWIFSLQGMVAAYNYTDESDSYGSVDMREEHDELVDGTQHVCPNCGTVLMEQELAASEQIAAQERDEFDPGDDDIVLHDLLNENKLLCPQCQIEVDPELKQNKVVVTRLTGVTRQPKARQCVEINGGLYVKVPNWARCQADIPYLSYNYETHYSNLYECYPELRDLMPSEGKISSSDGNQLYERWGRLSPQYRGEYPLNTPTVRNWWLRPSAFNCAKDEKIVKSLKKKFPDGIYCVIVNDTWVKACNQNLDDHWTLLFNPMSNYVQYDALGTLVTSVQEITVNLVSLELQCIEHSIPQTFFNPRFLNSEQYSKSEIAPGQMYPTKTIGENRNISDGFHTLQTASVSPELAPFGSKINEMGQFVSGALPQVWGGSSNSSSRTASQYAMQRNGSQQRLANLTGRDINFFWKNLFAKLIPAYIKNMLEDERVVEEQGNNNFINIVIKKSQMDGKIGDIRLEAPEGLPATIEQMKDTIMSLLQTGNEQILSAIGHPDNLPTLSKIIGLQDFHVPGEADREKQYEEIGLLLNSGPMPSPDGTEMPSIMPELYVDNHQVEAEVCRNWLVGEKGRQAKIDNPEGYKNILLHLQAHMMMLQQMSSGMAQAPTVGGQPQNNNVVQMRPALQRG